MSAPSAGVKEPVPAPVDRSKLGSKTRAILTDGQGVPLVIDTIPANTPDAQSGPCPLVDAVPPIAGKPRPPPETPGPCDGGPGL